MPRDWQSLVSGEEFSDVMRLVHLAMRRVDMEIPEIQAEMNKTRRLAYENELTILARKAGCANRRGMLTTGPSLSEINAMSERDATSIINTYNYDLAVAIQHIRSETPTANRHVYARRLQEWETTRAKWKGPQIAQYSEGTARSLAQRDFLAFNDITGTAVLMPDTAAEPICQGWIDRGEITLAEATNNPPPYHVNCFPPNAMVRLADGSEKPISQIEVGEFVATREGNCQVNQVFSRHTKEALYRVSVGGRDLELTGDHPVLTTRGWRSVRELQVGDRVMKDDNIQITIEDVEKIEIREYEGVVFNLETEKQEYIVSDVIVHNCPHSWSIDADKVPQSACQDLWVGE